MQVKFAAFLMVAGLVGMAAIKVDHAVNYVPVVATVTGVESYCRLEEKTFYVVAEETAYTDDMACDRAKALKASSSTYSGMTVKGRVTVAFNYTSPADGSFQTGELGYDYEDYDRLVTLSRGARLPILAHETEPDSVAQDYGEALDGFATRES